MINVEIHHDLHPDALQDKVDGALDYKGITKAMIHHVETGSFLLLEKLVNDLVGICSRDPAVRKAVVTVDKPHALRFADSVSVTLVYERASAAAGLSADAQPEDGTTALRQAGAV